MNSDQPKEKNAITSTNFSNETKLQVNISSSLNENISTSLDDNLLLIKSKIGSGIDLSIGTINIFQGAIKCGIAYVSSLSDKELVSNQIALLLENSLSNKSFNNDIPTFVQSFCLTTIDTYKIKEIDLVVEALYKGNTVIFFNDYADALIIKSKKLEKRAIDKPENESTIFSSKESFTEDIVTNISLILKRLPTTKLQIETFDVGSLSHTQVKVIWLKDIVNAQILDEVKKRIKNITIDMLDGIGVLSEIIQDKPVDIFPKYKQTERPDVVSKNLSEGRIAIISDNSSFAIIGPISFWDSFKTMDDYNELSLVSSLLRFTRFIAFIISITISPLYIAFVTYNHTIVPPSLALNISTGREGVPFPSIIELMGMTIIIDIIREAGIRMPGMVGYFIGTLGAVVIGQAAVSAGYVSVSLIIVVAFSAIATFGISSTILVNTARLINYFLIILSGFLGMFGFLNGISIILWRMATLESLGVPYLYPVFPIEFKGWKDVFIRAPFKTLKDRLSLLSPKDKKKFHSKKD
jgi:spore germination protein KA